MNRGIIFGLAAAAAWGAADFCAKKASGRFGCWSTLLGMNAVGALLLGAVALFGGLPALPVRSLVWLLLALANTGAGLLFYFALQHGRLSLVSPLTAAYPAVSVLLAVVFSHERLSGGLWVALAAVMGGCILASLGAPAAAGAREGAALLAAAGGAITFGVVFYGLAVRAGAGGNTPVLLFRLTGVAVLGLPLLPRRAWPRGLVRSGWIWATGLLDTGAYVLYLESARRLPASLAAGLAGLFTVFTLLLAALFLRERVRPRQWVGIAAIVAALCALSFR